ncbi:hypothetical protein V2H45_11050 [Tumidithrix elongata RA019]|uniref:VWA containing CoxE family protein n=1 Tax=Tumidithrix elongata BACA0141 TaxID=2716417 RepID=A0AAW9Q307_9CYAN|nr:hypothetical protein [Tumidithrix elongata RA019]
MSTFDAQSLLRRLFTHLCKRGFRPGVGKYLAAIAAVEQGYFGSSPDDLKSTLRLLWCQSRDELVLFEPLWDEIWQASQRELRDAKTDEQNNTQTHSDIEIIEDKSDVLIEPTASNPIAQAKKLQPKLDFVPVRAPKVTAIETEGSGELQEDFPISRRYMVYAWRHLRRLVPFGRQDILDVDATVSSVAERGFYLSPTYRRREVNRTHLLLFVDREGSMTPFHRFVRHLVETAQDESGLERVDVFYFRNVFEDIVFCDQYLTQPLALKPIATTKAALAECDRDAIAIVISDAGAARGHDSFERFHACTEFLYTLRQEVDTIVWLNPLPQERWRNTSAEKIAYFVPMYALEPEGLSAAIDRARGQTTRNQRS